MRIQESNFTFAIGILFLSIVLLAPMLAAEEKHVGETVNINTGTIEELAVIPLLTLDLAEAIVAYREEVGDFQFIEEVLLVDGFNEKLFQKMKPFFFMDSTIDSDCGC